MARDEENAKRTDSFSRLISDLEHRSRTSKGSRRLVATVRLFGLRVCIHLGFGVSLFGSVSFPVVVFLEWLPELRVRTTEAVISIVTAVGFAIVLFKIAVELW